MRREISRFVDLVRPAAEAKGLVASVLKLTAPGIPDFYQGTEFLDLSLVDPDNRRPVDFARRRAGLDAAPEDADARKQHLIHTLLRLRADESELFRGDYIPLDAGGAVPMAGFLRTGGGKALLVACPVRTFEQVTPAGGLQPAAWQGIKPPDGFRWRFAVPGLCEPVPSATDLAANTDWPFALLLGERG